MSPLAPGLILERDESVVEGEPKLSGGAKYYVVPGCQFITNTSTVISNGQDNYTGFWMARSPIVVDQLACEVITPGTATLARMGFYRADRNWQPVGGPLVDSGNLDVELAGVKTFTPSTPIAVRPGRYMSVFQANGTTTMRAYSSGALGTIRDILGASLLMINFRVTRSYGAFPTPGTAWDLVGASSSTSNNHIVFYRLSQS